MIHGVVIAGTDTLTEWGLLLCADLVIGTPPLKSNLVDIPGRNGSVNMSYAVSNGLPVFGDRQITFTLFSAVDDIALNQIRAELAAICHGQEATLVLPTDSTHFFRGVFAVGDISGYNSGKIPITVTAEPYAYKNGLTVISETLPSGGSATLDLTNEQMPATATITVDAAVTLTYGGTTYSISAGTRALPFTIPPGGTSVPVSGPAGTSVSVSYQEGRI